MSVQVRTAHGALNWLCVLSRLGLVAEHEPKLALSTGHSGVDKSLHTRCPKYPNYSVELQRVAQVCVGSLG